MTALYPWLKPYYQKITQAFQQQYGHHALLFRTDSGLGTEQLIQQIAQYLLCTQDETLRPCGHCHSCQLFQAGSHPDYHFIAPVDNKDIGVDSIRELSEKIHQHAQQQGNKVVFIQQAERMTESASNALLKTLEEPRPNTYFLLQNQINSPLIATIYSRCQDWLITVPAPELATKWLAENSQLELAPEQKTQQINTALLVNYGRPLSALATLQQGLIEKRREFLRAFWVFYIRRSPLELLPYFEKDLVFQQLDWLSAFLMDSLKAKLGINQDWINQDLARGVVQFSEKQQAQGLLKANQILQKVRQDLTQINAVNQELILLDGLTKLITEVFEPQ